MERVVAVDTRFMQDVNAAAVLAHLREDGPARVSSLAANVGLSRQAVTRSLAILEELKLVEISAPDRAAAPAGRPPQIVSFRPQAGYVVAVSVEPRQIRAAVADLLGEILAEARADVGVDVAASVDAAVLKALAAAGLTPDQVWHATAAAPGIVDPASGAMTQSTSMPAAIGDAIRRGLVASLDVPVCVDNDVKLATQGERWRGAPRAWESLVFIDWGERIGAGLVLGGNLYRGASNDAGDIGFLDLLAPADDAASASDLGPFERWVGSRALLRLASGVDGEPSTVAALAEAADRGDPDAITAIDVVGARFAKGIAAIRAIVDPEAVVIGGEVAILGERLLAAIRAALADEPLRQPPLEMSQLGARATLDGAVRTSLTWVERERFGAAAIRKG